MFRPRRILLPPLLLGLALACPVAWAQGGPDTGWVDSSVEVELWLYRMYGAVFRTTATPPPVVRFEDEAAVQAFQGGLDTATVVLGGRSLVLQAAAAEALEAAATELRRKGLSLAARGSGPGGRSYRVSVANWRSRLHPALRHWRGQGALTSAEVARIRALPDEAQIAAVLELEARGLWCSTLRDKTILASVAAPGSSQHHSLLAVDLVIADRRMTRVLADHGWHRTVRGDTPHFTFIGVPATELPARGLVPVEDEGRIYWVLPPDD